MISSWIRAYKQQRENWRTQCRVTYKTWPPRRTLPQQLRPQMLRPLVNIKCQRRYPYSRHIKVTILTLVWIKNSTSFIRLFYPNINPFNNEATYRVKSRLKKSNLIHVNNNINNNQTLGNYDHQMPNPLYSYHMGLISNCWTKSRKSLINC